MYVTIVEKYGLDAAAAARLKSFFEENEGLPEEVLREEFSLIEGPSLRQAIAEVVMQNIFADTAYWGRAWVIEKYSLNAADQEKLDEMIQLLDTQGIAAASARCYSEGINAKSSLAYMRFYQIQLFGVAGCSEEVRDIYPVPPTKFKNQEEPFNPPPLLLGDMQDNPFLQPTEKPYNPFAWSDAALDAFDPDFGLDMLMDVLGLLLGLGRVPVLIDIPGHPELYDIFSDQDYLYLPVPIDPTLWAQSPRDMVPPEFLEMLNNLNEEEASDGNIE